MNPGRDGWPFGRAALPVGVLLCLVLGLSLLSVRLWPTASGSPDFVRITDVPVQQPPAPPGPGASTGAATSTDTATATGAATGSYTEDCGRDQEGHRNSDNVVISPGVAGGAHHVHDYVGNLSTDALSTESTLAAAGTTCAGGDRSSYYWPVLRRTDRGLSQDGEHGNLGEILTPDTVSIEFLGNPWSQVVPMPRFLRLLVGDPTAATDGGANARARWGCSGFPGRWTGRYPLCPAGSLLTRTFEFPSCWDGRSTDSPGHRAQAVFPSDSGVCPHDTFPIPRLRVTVGYRPPPGEAFALDAFPEQRHSPVTDHGVFIDVMSDSRMASVVACLNQNRKCRGSD
ncbi:DUF1996 domain-containing protein [Saccharothrix sp. ST-888]|uniref:DUF1996 domain-containing protein n=1 Tax=Saccharothrix sp. ST-888 TaxID=1427391 RepID=UPI0005EC2E17|nr:DUF1996 domain-containing protein [Saccharothrix sp. ST-888]KJK55506.1 hypothetical protein UK12_28225 [Saccharothrix sp. ST-888]